MVRYELFRGKVQVNALTTKGLEQREFPDEAAALFWVQTTASRPTKDQIVTFDLVQTYITNGGEPL